MAKLPCSLKLGERSEPNQTPTGQGAAALKRKNASRIQQAFLEVWKPSKSDSRHHRETTNN